MSSDLQKKLHQSETAILQGDIRLGAEYLDSVDTTTLSRKDALTAAKLLRRVGHPDRALKLLSPYVRPKINFRNPATDAEKAEYAFSLQRMGSLKEATALVAEVDPNQAPEGLLYRAIFLFSRWNYAEAIPLLQQVLGLVPPTDYLYRLTQINLAAAYTNEERLDEAIPLLEELIQTTATHNEHLLRGNAFEISAQIAVQKRDFKLAETHLENAGKHLRGVKILDFLWLIKWKGIVEALKTGTTEPLDAVRTEAERKKHWETLREVDFYRLQVKFDPNLFYKLFFGTSSPHYRARVLKIFKDVQIPNAIEVSKHWNVTGAPSPGSLNLFWDTKDELAPGGLAHTLLGLLMSDWYRGFRSGELHSILFPGEFFNPETGLNRVHQVVTRLRKSIEEQLPGIALEINGSIYSIAIESDQIRIQIPRDMPEATPAALRAFAFQQKYGTKSFSSGDLQDVFGLSRSAANKLLKTWRESGVAELDPSRTKAFYKLNLKVRS